MFDKIQMILMMKTSISKNCISRLNYIRKKKITFHRNVVCYYFTPFFQYFLFQTKFVIVCILKERINGITDIHFSYEKFLVFEI